MNQRSEPQRTTSLQNGKPQVGADSDAALEQMFGYFSRKEQPPRKIVSELDAVQLPRQVA